MEKEKSLFTFEVCFFDGKDKMNVPVIAEYYTINDGLHLFVDNQSICSFREYIYVKKLEPKKKEPPADFTKVQLELLSKKKITSSFS